MSVNKNEHEDHPFKIKIDKNHYSVTEDSMTGLEIKRLGGVSDGYELWLEQPGDIDLEVKDSDTIEIKHGMKFFSTSPTINPGAM